MNILMLAPLPPPSGGIATWTIRYKEFCAKKDIELNIVNISMVGKRASKETKKKNIFDEIQRSIRIIRDLKRELKQKTPDVIHINTSCSRHGVVRDAICLAISKRYAPTLIHCRCNIEDQLKGKRAKKAFSFMVKGADAVIVLNSFSKRYVDSICLGKAIFIPNFISAENIRDYYEVHDTLSSIIVVGHIGKSKGLLEIIDTAKKNPSITFNLVGAVREDISNLVIPENIKIIGRIEHYEVLSWLDRSDVFLLPTKSEGFSNAILESMARGIPIITSAVGANFDMIETRGGFALEKCNGVTISDAIEELKDKEIRQSMSNWNINKVRACYESDTVMSQYFDLYKKLEKRAKI